MATIEYANEPDINPKLDPQAMIEEGWCVWPPPGTDVEEKDRLLRKADEEWAISEVPDGRGADQSG